MMKTLLRLLLFIAYGLPLLAHAGPANEFAAASRSQQAVLLQQWAADPQPERLPLLETLKQENVVTDDAKHAFAQNGTVLTPLEGDAKPQGDTKKVWLNNRLRILIANALCTPAGQPRQHRAFA